MGLEANKLFFCIPSKVGLLAYGYLNLLFILYGINEQFESLYYYGISGLIDIMVISFMFIETIFTIIFMIGMYKNQPRSLKAFFWYKIATCLVIFIGFAISEVYYAVGLYKRQTELMIEESYYMHRAYLMSSVSRGGVVTAFMIYILVAVRRHYLKLDLEQTKGTEDEDFHKSTNNLLLAGKNLRDDFKEFTNEIIKSKSLDA